MLILFFLKQTQLEQSKLILLVFWIYLNLLKKKFSYDEISELAETSKDDVIRIAEENGLPLTMEPRLIEQNFGEFEGHEWAKHRGVFHEAKKQFACDYNGGESMLRLGQRIYNLIDELKERSQKENKTFLLVTHGGIARMFHSYFFSETNEEFSSTNIENCEIKEYVWD